MGCRSISAVFMPDSYGKGSRKPWHSRTRGFRNVWDARSSVAGRLRESVAVTTVRDVHYAEMRLRLRAFRRLVPLALPCWLLGGPFAATLQSVAACPHHDAMPSSMDHGAGSRAPCWCAGMSGAVTIEVPTLPAASLESGTLITGVAAVAIVLDLQSLTPPESPSFPPTPPPPNAGT